jgi:hypothetical protein
MSSRVILFLGLGMGYGLKGEYGIGFKLGNMLELAI